MIQTLIIGACGYGIYKQFRKEESTQEKDKKEMLRVLRHSNGKIVSQEKIRKLIDTFGTTNIYRHNNKISWISVSYKCETYKIHGE